MMRSFQRIICVLLAVLLIFSLAACDSGQGSKGGSDDPAPAPSGSASDDGSPRAIGLLAVTVSKADTVEAEIPVRISTSFERLYPIDDLNYRKLAERLSDYFDADAEKQDLELSILASEAEVMTARWASAYWAEGLYAKWETTVYRSDTRMLSFTQSLSSVSEKMGGSFICTNIDTVSGEFLDIYDILDDREGFFETAEALAADEFGKGTELTDPVIFTAGYQGVSVFVNAPGSGLEPYETCVFISFAEHPDLFKAYYLEVPETYAVPLRSVEVYGFDTGGSGKLTRIAQPEERGGSWVMKSGGKTFLAAFENEDNPWLRVSETSVDWKYTIYEVGSGGSLKALGTYPGKPAGNCVTDPAAFIIQTGVDAYNTPVNHTAAIGPDGVPYDEITGRAWETAAYTHAEGYVPAKSLYGAWSSSYVAGPDGDETICHLNFYNNGFMRFWFEDRSGSPYEDCSGTWKYTEDHPQAQFSKDYVIFDLLLDGGSAFEGYPYELWGLNTVRYPDPANPDCITVTCEQGDALLHGHAGYTIEFYRVN